MTGELHELFLDYSADKFKQCVSRIEDCLGRLTSDQVWMRGAETDNAVGNIILHLCGNVKQWIGSGVGGQPDTRDRDAEFAARSGAAPSELCARLAEQVSGAIEIIRAQTADTLLDVINVQGYNVSKLEAIYHVVEHFAGHTGQIIFATKLLTGEDLGFYRHLSGPPKPLAATADSVP